MIKYLTILLFLWSCNKAKVEPQQELPALYSFEVITPNATSIRYTTDMVKFIDSNHTGNWKYEWQQLPSTHKPITFQVGIFQCCLKPITLRISKDGYPVVEKTLISTQYSIAY